MYGENVLAVPFNELRHVGFESEVAVIRTADEPSVEVGVAVEHDALEVQDDAVATPRRVSLEGLAVPPGAHLLEATPAAGLLVPRHLNLEVMRQIQLAPCAVIEIIFLGSLGLTQMEAPVEVEEFTLALAFCHRC